MAKEISYIIGKKSYTPKRNVLDKENLKIIEKQFSLSIPLITGAKINDKKKETNIFIGKEIDLQEFFYKKTAPHRFDAGRRTMRINFFIFCRLSEINLYAAMAFFVQKLPCMNATGRTTESAMAITIKKT